MEKATVTATQREVSYIQRYINGEIGKMYKRIEVIYEKYKGQKTEDMYILYLNYFFADNYKELFKYKKLIQEDMKDNK